VELGSRIADATWQLRFNIHVHVLKFGIKGKATDGDFLFDLMQARFDARKFLLGKNPRVPQRPRMRDASTNVLTVKPPVKGNRFAVGFEQAGGRLLEASLPHEYYDFGRR
jgi:hypothetical protein